MFDVRPFRSHFWVLTFSEHTAPNEPGQFCSLFVLEGAMKYSGLVLPWDQAGGCGFVSMPRLALLSSVSTPAPWTIVLRGGSRESTPSKNIVPFSAHLHRRFFLHYSTWILHAIMRFLPPHCLIVAYLMYGYFQQVRVWDIALCGLCQFMTNGEVLHYTLSWAGEQVCFIHNLVDSNRLLRLGNWSRYYHTGPRHGERTGRNKLCIKALVSFSPRQSYIGYNVTLPKATINSWLHGFPNVYFLLSWNIMTSRSEIQLYPWQALVLQSALIRFTLAWDEFRENLIKF